MRTIDTSFSPEDGEYVALCADYSSLLYLAKTEEAATNGMRELIALIEND